MVEYEHGTIADKADVPSSFGLDAAQAGIEGRWSTELFASAGFAVAEPDYVGMGRSPGRPQYMVATSEVSASLDLLRAAAQLAGERGGRLDRGVLVTGFSQGGAAAMAVGRALQERAASPFLLGALAPVSGPYDLPGADVPGMFDGQVEPAMASYLVAYTLTAWNPLYRLYRYPGDAFRGAYASSVSGLFDGSHSGHRKVAASGFAGPAHAPVPQLATPSVGCLAPGPGDEQRLRRMDTSGSPSVCMPRPATAPSRRRTHSTA
jgi:pimeloyl-ACP methyl ester carboxylesterase